LPTTFARTVGIFVSFSGLSGKAAIDVDFLDAASGEILMHTRSMEISCEHPEQPVDLALEVPPLPLLRAGRYVFRLTVNGTVLGEAAVAVDGPGGKR
jgi:hypothetical protein